MAFPTIATTSLNQGSYNSTDYPVTLPSGITAGDLLLVWVAASNTAQRNFADPSGWTRLGHAYGNTDYESYVWAKVAAGSDTMTVAKGGANSALSYCAYRIQDWYGSLAGVEINGPSGVFDYPNPPSLNPTGWDVEDTLWIVGGMSNPGGAGTYPTNYSLGQLKTTDNGEAWIAAMAARQLAAASEDPDAFNIGSGAYGQAFTVAVRPAAGGGGGFKAARAAYGTNTLFQ